MAAVLAVLLSAGLGVAAAVLPADAATVHSAATIGASPLNALADGASDGRGATVPFTEYEAEDAATNGKVIGEDRTFGTLAAEASGREAVQLTGQGQYVRFTLSKPANAVDVHYAVPDSADGSGITEPLSLYVDGTKRTEMSMTSKYSDFYGSYPFSNRPGDGKGHHFYDDVRYAFGSTLPAGSTVELRVDAGDDAPWYVIDTADFEQVAAPAVEPAGYLDVTDYGADPSGAKDSTAAIQSAIDAGEAQGRGVWIPRGTFTVTGHLIVDRVTLAGAGPWYSVLHGLGVGVYGNAAPNPSTDVHLSGFAIFGETTDRDDSAQVNGVGGAIGGGSTIDDLWIQHTKVGMWFDGPFDGLTITDCRIQDTTADGINLHDGISHVKIRDNFVRNTGDDGLAMWSEHNADHDDSFADNTVELPILANNIAIYGGHDNSVTGNVVADTLTQGGGIHVGNRFSAVPLAGTTTISGNDLIRTGVLDPNWQFGVGALWFWAEQGAMTGTIKVSDLSILDSSYEAIQTIGSSVSNVSFDHVTIDGTGTFVLQLQSPGAASFTDVTATHVGAAGIYDCQTAGAFTVTKVSGDTGWGDSYCGPWPAPVYTYGNPPTTPPSSNPPTTPAPTTTPPTATPTGGDLAQGASMSDTGHTQNYVASNAVDGNASTYWESTDNAFPQSLTADLHAPQGLGRLVLELPPATAWATRSQTITIAASTDGSSYRTILPATAYTFDPSTGNTVTVDLPAGTTARYLRLTFTANTGWPAGQLSELEAYAS